MVDVRTQNHLNSGNYLKSHMPENTISDSMKYVIIVAGTLHPDMPDVSQCQQSDTTQRRMIQTTIEWCTPRQTHRETDSRRQLAASFYSGGLITENINGPVSILHLVGLFIKLFSETATTV